MKEVIPVLRGDISNRAGHTIAFRCEDFLIEFQDDGIKNRVLNSVMGRLKRAKVNDIVRSYMEHLYRNTEYNVDLVVEYENNTPQFMEFLESYPFNRVVLIHKISEISQRLNTGDLTYYVDDDSNRRSLINSKYAVTLEQIASIVKVGRVR